MIKSKSIALVIGNNNYRGGIQSLTNSVPDAKDVSQGFRDMGMDVLDCYDCKIDKIYEMEEDFAEKIKPGVVAVVYYSGHGVERNGKNYMLPVDMPAVKGEGKRKVDTALMRNAWNMNAFQKYLAEQNPDLYVVILDACRDDPFADERSGGSRGLAKMQPMGGVIMYATKSGQTASDNSKGKNGRFAEQFLKNLKPDIPIQDLLKRTMYGVRRASR